MIFVTFTSFFWAIQSYSEKKTVSSGVSRHDFLFYSCLCLIPFAAIMLLLTPFYFNFSYILILILLASLLLRYGKMTAIVSTVGHLVPYESEAYMCLGVILAYVVDCILGIKGFSYQEYVCKRYQTNRLDKRAVAMFALHIQNHSTYNMNINEKGDISEMYQYNDYNENITENDAFVRHQSSSPSTTDYGPNPFVVDINKAVMHNSTFRTALWTGKHLQLTLMSIPVGGDIGAEAHPNVDQFLRIEEGQGLAQMGNSKDNLNLRQPVFDDSAIFVPAGTWHNLINTGDKPLKLYSIYSPPNHPWGTIHPTKAIAEAAE